MQNKCSYGRLRRTRPFRTAFNSQSNECTGRLRIRSICTARPGWVLFCLSKRAQCHVGYFVSENSTALLRPSVVAPDCQRHQSGHDVRKQAKRRTTISRKRLRFLPRGCGSAISNAEGMSVGGSERPTLPFSRPQLNPHLRRFVTRNR